MNMNDRMRHILEGFITTVLLIAFVIGIIWLVSYADVPRPEEAKSNFKLCDLYKYSPLNEVPVSCLKELTR